MPKVPAASRLLTWLSQTTSMAKANGVLDPLSLCCLVVQRDLGSEEADIKEVGTVSQY